MEEVIELVWPVRPLSRRTSLARRDSGASEAGSSSGMRSVRAARLGPRLPTINLEQRFRGFLGELRLKRNLPKAQGGSPCHPRTAV